MSKKDINIQKATPTELFAKKAPYSSLSNDVVASIRNPDALAIWVYLQTRSGDWKVIGSYLQTHFDIGRDRYRKAMADLTALSLISHELQRDPENGQVLGKRIIVHYEPNIQVSAPSEPEDSPNIQVSHYSADPHSGETAPYLIKDSITGLLEEEPTGDKSPSLPRKSSKFDPIPAKPANVSAEAWSDWCQHRREIRKPLTAKTCEQQAKALLAHSSPDAVINLSISNGWTGLFPDKVLPTNSVASRHNGFAGRDYSAGLTPREGGGYAF
jgi:hypothetical protein